MKTAISLAAALVSGAVAADDRHPYFDVPLSTMQSFVQREAFTLESHTRDPADNGHLYKYVYKAGEHKQVILITTTNEKQPRVTQIAYAWWITGDRGAVFLVATTFMKLVNQVGTEENWSLVESARFLEQVLDWVASRSRPFLATAHGLQFMGLHTQGVTMLFLAPDSGTSPPAPSGPLTLLPSRSASRTN